MSVRPKKGLGQHFLAEPSVVRQIVDAVNAPPEAQVVEIGPGEGAMTGALLARYPDLIALEIDGEAIAHLRQKHPTLDLREGDVLDVDWAALAHSAGAAAEASGARGESAARLHIVGNLPYYITSPILFSLLDAREHVARAVVMVQKEVADRIVAPEGSKTYGTLSVYFALLARAELLFDVDRRAFRPPPNVESAVVAIDFTNPPEAGLDSAALRRVVRAAFGQRRKMLRNSLRPLAQETAREIPEWAATLRPEQVSPADFVRLTHAFFSP
ncbi:16S rRNA (adenine(1518)-N(6)/adenine(1519)-N(6))-dimethyltransferase RsmA [Rubricoccus marinus]|uniref:Ribosomal RNA small subunit methyltransferase A n=1 Tax=Rubricoccus marinus TaxID=716817 RepID=A0A259TWR1_9BACT|nr:16S rRNA (adenine(1518)-N(6)/adenine(1519)-N(6))-dimethyltransferase RsmA [Rubricoccus marinus]OZC02212.1 ribosomal RNA small subunit methyltransferase A [Rubricoccus marinus]